MASIYKPTYTKPIPPGAEIVTRKGQRYARYRDRRGKLRTELLTKTGKRLLMKNQFYWAKFTDAQGIEAPHPLRLPNGEGVTDKSVAQELLREVLQRVEREAAGLTDPFVEAASTPMRTVLGRYLRHLRRKGCGRSHVEQVRSYVKWMMERADIHRLADFNEDRIDRALGTVADKGRSPRTVNVYRRCAHSFGEWCVKVARVLDRNPVAAIGLRNETADKRKVRRSLSIDEARRLLNVCGPRRLFYAVQLWTGLRVSEVRALQWRDLQLDGDRPCITLRAETTKSKRADELSLHPDLAEALIESKPPFAQPTDQVFKTAPGLRTFRGGWYNRDGKRKYQQGDLDRAGITFEDDRGRTIDRHALRTTFISWLGQYGVDPRAQVMLARHAPQGVTLRNYQDFGVFDLWAEIRKLPGLKKPEQDVDAATGTYDVKTRRPLVPGLVPTHGISQLRVATSDTDAETQCEGRIDVSRCGDSSKHRMASPDTLEPTGLEPATFWLQTRRSPD